MDVADYHCHHNSSRSFQAKVFETYYCRLCHPSMTLCDLGESYTSFNP
jgi:hypothetical protein